jgi:hypothetical protein
MGEGLDGIADMLPELPGPDGFRSQSKSRPRSIALPCLIFICVEHRLPLVAVSTEWPVIMPRPQRLRIRLANLQLVKLILQTGQLWCLV